MEETYEEAIRRLNELQTKAASLDKAKRPVDSQEKLTEMIAIVGRLGLTLDDIDCLHVIHVSGTKGKGSTCAFCDSILRHCGYRTGLFTSPHLVEVRDRFRINGQRLSREQFSFYFWQCYNRFQQTKEDHDGLMPTYFKFLTAMCFYLFSQEKVDVAIIEVGLGGAHDCTNIVLHPTVCGVSALDYDHTAILGKTIELIAWHKAGIFKRDTPAFTVDQEAGGMDVLYERAAEVGAILSVVPDLSLYPGPLPELGLSGKYQQSNAALALQLCQTWIQMRENGPRNGLIDSILVKKITSRIAPTFEIPEALRLGLKNCWWPGRSQMICRPGWTLFVDGAHTVRSAKACMEWFLQAADEDKKSQERPLVRVLLFHCTGGRKPQPLLEQIKVGAFDFAIFCPNVASLDDKCFADQTSFKTTYDHEMKTCQNNERTWRLLNDQSTSTHIFPCLLKAFQCLIGGRDPLVEGLLPQMDLPDLPDRLTQSHLQVLVCGSVLLVGAVFKALGPLVAPVDRI